MKKEYWIYLFIFLACVVSKVLNADPLYLPDDPESLYYMLQVDNATTYSYSLFVTEVRVLKWFMPNYSAFGFAGGIATFILIISSIRLLNVSVFSLKGLLLAALIFFNPLIWFYGNHYSPHLTAAALVMMAWAMGLRHRIKIEVYLFWAVIALLIFIMPFYLIFLLPLVVYIILQSRNNSKAIWAGALVFFVSVVLLMMSVGESFTERITTKTDDRTKYSYSLEKIKETIDITPMQKATLFFKTCWANVAGGWWSDRPLWLILPTLFTMLPVIYFLYSKTFFNSSLNEYMVLVSGLLYAGVVFLWSDVYSWTADLLPLAGIFLVIVVLGISKIIDLQKWSIGLLLIGSALVLYALNTITIHRQQTALSNLVSKIKESSSAEKTAITPIVTASELMRETLSYVVAGRQVFSAAEDKDIIPELDSGYVVSVDKRVPEIVSRNSEITTVGVFSHSPYLNPTWTSITLYKYKRK